MRKILLTISAILAVLSASAAVHVIPEPVSVQEGKGCFNMTKGAKVDCADESLLRAAEIFAADMNTVLGVQLPVADFNRVQFALLPRLAAICETAWAYDRKKDLNSFVVKAKTLLPGIYQSYGYHYALYFFEGIE